MTVFGWDASDFDWNRGPMNLVAARDAGVAFFTHKATEGTTTKHAHYGEALNRAKAAGIEFLGAYIVPRSAPSVVAQVDYFMAYVNSQTPWWTSYPGFFFQVDTEKWSSNGVVYDAVSPQRGADVCAEIKRRTGRRVVHYAPNWSYGDSVPQPDPLWASGYGGNGVGTLQQMYPGDTSTRWNAYSGRTPVFLQFGSKVVIGAQNTCDGNAYRGTVADLRKFITGSNGSAGGEDDVLTFYRVSETGACGVSSGPTRWGFATMEDLNEALASQGKKLSDLRPIPAARINAYGADVTTFDDPPFVLTDETLAKFGATVTKGVSDAMPGVVDALIAKLPANAMTREDVESAVRDAFAGGLAPDADAPVA